MRLKKAMSITLFLLLSLLILDVRTAEMMPMTEIDSQYLEVARLRDEFSRMVGNQIVLESDYLKIVLADISELLSTIENLSSQYFVYVDRSPNRQLILVCFLNSQDKSITLIGADKVSTGNPKRPGFFITPTGVFENTIEFIGYRALGTKNADGWRGLGVKGSRVWDFGWQKTYKNNRERTIRLLMHATDPVFGERRLGKIDSKGCIRISNKLNKFLDHFGLLDKEYEANKNNKKIAWLLKAEREPVAYAGKYLLIGDSGK